MTWCDMKGVSSEVEYLFGQACKLVDREEYTEAMVLFNKAVEISPGFSNAYNELGICAENLNQFDEAAWYYAKAVECDPFDADAWFNRGMNFGKTGHPKDSAQCVEKAIDLYCGR